MQKKRLEYEYVQRREIFKEKIYDRMQCEQLRKLKFMVFRLFDILDTINSSFHTEF